MKAPAFLLSLALMLLPASALAAAQEFTFGDGKDVVAFTSDAPVEVIQGSTNNVKGHVRFDDTMLFDAKHPFEMMFEVDLRTLDTGIPLRNVHMRENFLETDKYPKATFKARKIKLSRKPTLKKVEEFTVTATGDLSVHGVTVEKTIPLKVTYLPESDTTQKRAKSGNLVRVRGTFPVKLSEHRIQRPEAVFVKLAETIYLNVDLTGTDGQFK